MARLSNKTWSAVFTRDKGFCQYCGDDLLATLSSYKSATVDHVLSQAAGGLHEHHNLVLSCQACNGLLSDAKTIITFEERKVAVLARRAAWQTKYQQRIVELRANLT